MTKVSVLLLVGALTIDNSQINGIRVNRSNQEQMYAMMADLPAELQAPGGGGAKKEEKKEDAKADAKADGKADAKAGANASANGTANGTDYSWYQPVDKYDWRNWFDVADKKEDVKLKDDTPFHIKSNPTYKKMVGRFLSGSFKDKNLEIMKADTAKNTINHEEIGEEKEREGMYPNQLDDEMQNYKYGDKLVPEWRAWSSANVYGDYWNHQGTLAPPFKPDAHFESPYYDYGNRGWNYGGGYGGYWGVAGFDPWSKPWALLGQKNKTHNNNSTSLAQPKSGLIQLPIESENIMTNQEKLDVIMQNYQN